MLRRCAVEALRHLPLAGIAAHVAAAGLSLVVRVVAIHL
jgi:hypothetical protein